MQQRSVLVVEDDRDIREALSDLLEMEGFKVYTAGNGKEALSVLKEISSPCVVLLDLFMPVMSGFEFLTAQSHDHIIATIPVIIVSAVADDPKARAKSIA